MTLRELLRPLVILALLALPTLSLIGFGVFWLWQAGNLWIWSIIALLSAFVGWLLSAAPWTKRKTDDLQPEPQIEASSPDPDWSPLDERAWKKVLAFSSAAKPEDVTTRAELLDKAIQTMELVSEHYFPDTEHAAWRFTLPEALLLIEQSANRLRKTCHEQIPLADKLRLSEIRWLYGWAPAVSKMKKIWDWWRVGRSIANPLGAITAEIREKIMSELQTRGKTYVQKRLLQLYIEEVGRSAINLYSGKLRYSDEERASQMTDATKKAKTAEPGFAEPIRILVAGQTNSGKSSLINALIGETRATTDKLPVSNGFVEHRMSHETAPSIHLIDAPAGALETKHLKKTVQKSIDSDLILWVCAANRADRAADKKALESVKAYFAKMPERVSPSIVLCLTQIDRLRPISDWDPPYDIQSPERAKEKSIRAAMDAVAEDLDIPLSRIVPIRLDGSGQTYNVDLVWSQIIEMIPKAKKARLLRLRQNKEWNWEKLFRR